LERAKEEKTHIFADHERPAKQQAAELERAKEENKELSAGEPARYGGVGFSELEMLILSVNRLMTLD
jgi:hypothetical protein